MQVKRLTRLEWRRSGSMLAWMQRSKSSIVQEKEFRFKVHYEVRPTDCPVLFLVGATRCFSLSLRKEDGCGLIRTFLVP